MEASKTVRLAPSRAFGKSGERPGNALEGRAGHRLEPPVAKSCLEFGSHPDGAKIRAPEVWSPKGRGVAPECGSVRPAASLQ